MAKKKKGVKRATKKVTSAKKATKKSLPIKKTSKRKRSVKKLAPKKNTNNSLNMKELLESDLGCCFITIGGNTTRIPNITELDCHDLIQERDGATGRWKEGSCPP